MLQLMGTYHSFFGIMHTSSTTVVDCKSIHLHFRQGDLLHNLLSSSMYTFGGPSFSSLATSLTLHLCLLGLALMHDGGVFIPWLTHT